MKINTGVLKSINELPSPELVLRRSKSLAVIDAILMPEWEYRYFSFNANWDIGESIGSMRDGEGDHYFILFISAESLRVIGKVFSESSGVSENEVSSIIGRAPKHYAAFCSEPAFSINEMSFCFWVEDNKWVATPKNNNLEYLGFLVDSKIYSDWASKYYETSICKDAIDRIYGFEPLSEDLVNMLNPAVSMSDVMDDIKDIAYPTAGVERL